jgi:SAM-dependent methyltransferase
MVLADLGPGLRGLDVGCNMGYMSHNLQRQGFAMTGLDFDGHHLAVARALNQTYRLNVRFIESGFMEFESQERYDVLVCLTVLYHVLFRQGLVDRDAAIQKLDALVGSALFWESGDNPAAEKQLISSSGLTRFLSLGTTSGTGLKREMGVFLRPGTRLSEQIEVRYLELLSSMGIPAPHASTDVKICKPVNS